MYNERYFTHASTSSDDGAEGDELHHGGEDVDAWGVRTEQNPHARGLWTIKANMWFV